MKKRRSLTFSLFLIVSFLIGCGIWAYLSPQQFDALVQLVRQRVTTTPETEVADDHLKPGEPAMDSSEVVSGNDLIRRSRQMMQEQLTSFSAEILQIIQTPEMSYSAKGAYVQTSRLQSRLEISMEIKGIQGHLLQVSNGQVVWTVREVKNLKPIRRVKQDEEFSGEEVRIERVDLKRLADFAGSQQISFGDPRFAREFLTGIPGLLAALEAEMDFKFVKKVALQGVPHFIIQGEWKIPPDQREFDDSFAAKVFAGEVPQRVRLYLRASDLMLVRYLCLKKRPDGNGWYAPLAMELSHIMTNESINPSIFQYSPAGDQVPKDVTHKYLDRLKKTFPLDSEDNQQD